MKKLYAGLSAIGLCALAGVSEAAFEHELYEGISLNGTWEMAYRPYEWVSVAYPDFKGVEIEGAIPGYWEDMVEKFRSAGIRGEFRINPWYEHQQHPILGWASDTTLPDIYGNFFYRRKLRLDRVGPAVLRFEGVRNQVHLWINGRFVSFRAGFSTPFELTIPNDILKIGENEIVLAVANIPNLGYCDYVYGLTTRALFRSTGGVNGNLELRLLKGKLADVYVTTAKDRKSFTVHAGGGESFRYQILDGETIKAQGEAKGDFTLDAAGYEFWSPENPHRYELKLTTASGTYTQRFGLRRLTAAGEKLELNGEPIYLRGVTEHCYFAKTIHLPRDLDYYRMITAKRKELGFNFVRFHTFIPPVEYLEATDELGMLVHLESPNFVSEPEFAAIVAFARRHPSVVIYCTGNETRIDRLAETYLEDVAKLVHEGSDALFSPMSALRALEYALSPEYDTIEKKPFRHNPERMARVAKFSDLFTSYQLGITSYDSLNGGSVAQLDAMGDAYEGRPRLSHEICIDGSYPDLGLEALYPQNSPIVKAGVFSGIRRQLAEKGLLNRADAYFRNSSEWMRRVRKHCFEKLRAADRVVGYDFLGDINTHWHTFGYFVGMMDEFYRLKPGETKANVLRYNSAAVLLANFGSDFNFLAGSERELAFTLSNYAGDASAGELKAELVAADTGKAVTEWSVPIAANAVPNGRVSALATWTLKIPATKKPQAYLLKVSYAGGAVRCDNEWELYAFPKVAPANAAKVKVVGDISASELKAAMAKGERVLLLGPGPFKSLPISYRIGLAGRCAGNYATLIQRNHPALGDFPHADFCGWQFRRLLEGARAVQLEAPVPFDPIVDVASSEKCVIRQATMFEYAFGEGRLLVAAFNFNASDPASAYLREQLVAYAASEAFKPRHELTGDELEKLLAMPLVSPQGNRNRARNPADPAGSVRAEGLEQP